jgi:hypothetical protein
MSASAHPPAAPFLWGSFETFPVDDVLAVLALSRQLVDVRLSDAEQEVGAITVKAGHVLGAEDFRTSASGAAALKTLARDPGTAFSVTMVPDEQAEMRNAAVIGTLSELFPEAGNGRVPGAAAPAPARGSPEAGPATRLPARQPGPAARKPVDDSTRDVVPRGYESRARDAATAPAREAAPAGGLAADTGDVPPEAEAADEVLLHGTLEGIRFEELLEVLQLNPGPIHILFRRDGTAVGTLDLMSGQVGKTTAGSLHGREAFARLWADPGETFEVQGAEGVQPADVLGGLSELLVEARESGTAPSVTQGAPRSERSLFMEGRLADFSFELLIGSLHLFQQPIELELRGDGDLLHRVQLKSGRIVSAESAGTGAGDRALTAIRENPGTGFIVYRRRQLDDGTTIAPLRVLISEPEPAPVHGGRVAGTAGRPSDVPAAPVRTEAETDNDRLSGIEGRLDAVAAGVAELRQALQAEKQAPGEAPQVPQALSEFVSATASFVAVLEKSHKDALQQVTDTLRTRHRGLLRVVIVLQVLCLAAIGFVAALAAL